MVENDLLNIALAPASKINDELAQKLATILNLDIYRSRALLNSKIPKIISRQTDLLKAEEILNRINSLGLAAFSYKNSVLKQSLHSFKANSIEFGDSYIIFKDKTSQLFRLEKKNVFLILKANIKSSMEKEIVNKIKKLDITATLLTGGIPISKTKNEKTKEITTENECFLRIFENISMDFCVEIRQHGFNYSFLGTNISPSSVNNFNLLAQRLQNFFPQAVFDDKLKESTSISNSFNSPYENFDINCKLIYLYYKAINKH
jgi:hypothetical protein